jgi:hypothetical protein
MPTPELRREVNELASKLQRIHGGVKEDYFAVHYQQREHNLKQATALDQIAFGGNDYGIDAFHFDQRSGNLYLYQLKFSDDCRQFIVSLKRLAEGGLERIFVTPNQDPQKTLF